MSNGQRRRGRSEKLDRDSAQRPPAPHHPRSCRLRTGVEWHHWSLYAAVSTSARGKVHVQYCISLHSPNQIVTNRSSLLCAFATSSTWAKMCLSNGRYLGRGERTALNDIIPLGNRVHSHRRVVPMRTGIQGIERSAICGWAVSSLAHWWALTIESSHQIIWHFLSSRQRVALILYERYLCSEQQRTYAYQEDNSVLVWSSHVKFPREQATSVFMYDEANAEHHVGQRAGDPLDRNLDMRIPLSDPHKGANTAGHYQPFHL